jgi:2-dehydro-3-deoxygalactonokinase
MKKKYLLGCDWGTSSFRLWLFDMVEQRVVGQLHTGEGIANTHKLWESQEHKDRLSQEQFFRSELSRHTTALSRKLSMDLREVGVELARGVRAKTKQGRKGIRELIELGLRF